MRRCVPSSLYVVTVPDRSCRELQENGLIFLETSAKTAQNVEEAFINTVRSMLLLCRFCCFCLGAVAPALSPQRLLSGIRKGHLRTEATERRRRKRSMTRSSRGCSTWQTSRTGAPATLFSSFCACCSTVSLGKTVLIQLHCAVSRWESTPGVVARPGARATARTRAAAANACGSCLLPLCCMSNENSVSLVAADTISKLGQ